jgi:hypothetical protein
MSVYAFHSMQMSHVMYQPHLLHLRPLPAQYAGIPEPVKRNETLSYDAFCRTSSSVTGSLIHAMVGSFGGSGLRLWNRMGLAA